MSNSKRPRLFVSSPLSTNETPCYCGDAGDLDATTKGLAAFLKSDVEELLACHSNDEPTVQVSLSIVHMTDEEVAALPDV